MFGKKLVSKLFLLGTGSIILTVWITKWIYYRCSQRSYSKELIRMKRQELKRKKQQELMNIVNSEWTFEEIEEITTLRLNDLIDGIASGLYTHERVLQAYLAKAIRMDKKYNFITDINPHIKDDLDAIKSGKGKLKGIPVSIKENFCVKGCDSTYGMVDQIFKPTTLDHSMVAVLRSLGMIPFVTTNISQSGFSAESLNPIYGQTLNPRNPKMTCGGSSCGEGAILGSEASILGLGSDIGGSIRIPASFAGIYGLKPTTNRFSSKNSKNNYSKQNIIKATVGPMARHVDDLILFYKEMAVSNIQKFDPYCPPLGFNNTMFQSREPLKIGFYTHLGGSHVTPVPAVVRAVEIAKVALETAGHQVIEFTIPDIDNAIFNLFFKCLFSDGGVGYLNHFIKDNPVDSSINKTVFLLKLPNLLKKFLSFLIRPVSRNQSTILTSMIGSSSIYNLWELNDEINTYKEMVYQKWIKEELDGLICPVLPIVALPPNVSNDLADIIGYTSIYNILEYPAGSAPVTKVNQIDIDELKEKYPIDTRTHRNIIEYQKDSIEMPVGVQCVSMVWQEEICLRMMRDISTFVSNSSNTDLVQTP